MTDEERDRLWREFWFAKRKLTVCVRHLNEAVDCLDTFLNTESRDEEILDAALFRIQDEAKYVKSHWQRTVDLWQKISEPVCLSKES